jgi:hypothetical protein
MPLIRMVMRRITEDIPPPDNSQFLTKTSRMHELPLPITDGQCTAPESKKGQNILTQLWLRDCLSAKDNERLLIERNVEVGGFHPTSLAGPGRFPAATRFAAHPDATLGTGWQPAIAALANSVPASLFLFANCLVIDSLPKLGHRSEAHAGFATIS